MWAGKGKGGAAGGPVEGVVWGGGGADGQWGGAGVPAFFLPPPPKSLVSQVLERETFGSV